MSDPSVRPPAWLSSDEIAPQKRRRICLNCDAGIADGRKYCSSSCYHVGSRQKATKETIEQWSIPEPNSGCWLWIGALTGGGYGTLSIGRKLWLAHRLSYRVFVADPSDLVVRHGCDNPACVNPEHLSLGSHADNTQDAVRRNRMEHGSKRWSAVLSEADIPQIRRRLLAGETGRSIARSYSVDPGVISLIKLGKIWRRA